MPVILHDNQMGALSDRLLKYILGGRLKLPSHRTEKFPAGTGAPGEPDRQSKLIGPSVLSSTGPVKAPVAGAGCTVTLAVALPALLVAGRP